jgi:hypothetical protein
MNLTNIRRLNNKFPLYLHPLKLESSLQPLIRITHNL